MLIKSKIQIIDETLEKNLPSVKSYDQYRYIITV